MKTIRETKLSSDKINQLENTEFDDSALDVINAAIDKALKMNGSQPIIEEIMSKMDYKFNEESIKDGFREFLSGHSVEELEPLKEYLESERDHTSSIIEKAQQFEIWHMRDYIKDPLASLFSELYEQTKNTGGRKIRGKGEYLLSILLGKEAKFTNDFDLSFGNQKIEVKAYGGRLDGNYSKAATVSPNTCYKILEDVFGKDTINSLKIGAKTGHDELFVKGNSDNPKRVILANTPAAMNGGLKFNLERKSSFILGLGKQNIERNWPDFIEALRAEGMNDGDIEKKITLYLKELYLERYSEYKQEAIITLVDDICEDIAKFIVAGDTIHVLSKVAELELALYVETATSNKIDRKLQNLILIGKTSTDDIYVLLIGFSNGNSLGANLGTNVEKGNVKTTKFDSSSQGSNIGLKLAGTRK